MRQLLVRYGEIGSKSHTVKQKMSQVLRQRVADRLDYEGLEYSSVSLKGGRIIVKDVEAEEAKSHISELPGVSSVSPAKECGKTLEEIKQAASDINLGETFGVKTHRAAETEFDSMDVNREVGSHIEDLKGAQVELDSPDTWIRVEVRQESSYVFTEKLHGPDGFPVGSSGSLAALVSGGIDSPVAAYEVMTRGADIVPIYFYNRPLAAEDHLLRFQQVVEELKRMNPSKEWRYFIVDMGEVNRTLMEEVEEGRMVVHRNIMLRVAEEIARQEGLGGIVTGESIGQKSSQTTRNLCTASAAIELPVHRPLLSYSKSEIVEKARDLDTYQLSKIDSACRSISPETPATAISAEELQELAEKTDIGGKVEIALENTEERSI